MAVRYGFVAECDEGSGLVDQASLVACMAYVDLNPIRAKIADRPEVSR